MSLSQGAYRGPPTPDCLQAKLHGNISPPFRDIYRRQQQEPSPLLHVGDRGRRIHYNTVPCVSLLLFWERSNIVIPWGGLPRQCREEDLDNRNKNGSSMNPHEELQLLRPEPEPMI